MCKYEGAISILINNFPKMRQIYMDNQAFYEGLPYLFYESEFENYIINQIAIKNNIELKAIFDFIENILVFGNEEIKDLVNIAIVESLYYDSFSRNFIPYIEPFFGKETIKSFNKFPNINME